MSSQSQRTKPQSIICKIANEVRGSTNGYSSLNDIKELFADFDTTSSQLGNTVVKNIVYPPL